MSISNRIKISEVLSKDLALRNNANVLFKKLDLMKSEQIILDFKNVESITRSFAHQYKKNKQNSNKLIIEENVPLNISKMFIVVSKSPKRQPLIDASKTQAITL
ncbi:MAG: STAS-like domain-containing protein [Candidatus Diapherotrites archaeon]|jgi:hypothetical protein|uniref:STAS-like domain-containing protein n=1 Tax=Candidatus Iainarchaeum sp. TaxID=3101447 RepID=A0A7K4C0H3_9ARCH|nr:STAS-like domain-containing protein [Candidatus Diapherotrites archaeon]